MIELTSLSGEVFFLNCSLIETMSKIPETKINLTNGKFYLVQENQEDVINKIIEYNRKIFINAMKMN
ncbi:MAG: flagellar FlbD family protein [Oscillospiraceae bacterium]